MDRWKPLAVLLSMYTAPLIAESPLDRRFAALARRYLDELPALAPVEATLLGDHRFDARLDEVSPEARARKRSFYQRTLEEVEAIPRAGLSRENQVDAALLSHRLRSALWHLDVLGDWAWNPLLYTQLSGGAVYSLMARDFAPLPERLRNVASRIEAFPPFFAQVRASLDRARVPKVHAETAVKQNLGVLRILEHMVRPRAGELPGPDRERLEGALASARAAVETHQKWLESELLPQAAGEFRLGAELFDQKLAFTLKSPLSRAEIRRRAESELRRVRDEMYELAKAVYGREHPYTEFPGEPSKAYKQAIIRAALELAYADVPPQDRIVEVAGEALRSVTEFTRARDLVTVPGDPLEIIVMPEFQRGVALAYCDAPGPLDAGQKTFYAVAPLPEEWTEKQVRSFLREYNVRSVHNLTVHEAVPGHHLQLAHANRYPSPLRAVLASGVFVEGWAVYTEQLMAEEGYMDGDPLLRLIALKWYLRAIANAIIDQAIHCEGMSREEALRLMVEEAFQEEREAAAKWVRAQLTSTQLSTYFVGYQEHRDLRRAVEKAWGKEFTLKRYHDTVLSFGSPPVQYVQALVLGSPVP